MPKNSFDVQARNYQAQARVQYGSIQRWGRKAQTVRQKEIHRNGRTHRGHWALEVVPVRICLALGGTDGAGPCSTGAVAARGVSRNGCLLVGPGGAF
eukprot:scaffold568932_cov53-Prasinocladus_malaysianus.AAC.2